MARNERYITTVELNSQQATDRLKELEQKVRDLKKAKEEALKSGGFFDESSLKKATKELSQWRAQMTGVQGILDNINDVTLEDLQKGLRKLKTQSKNALPGTQEFNDIQQGIIKIEDRIKELRNSTREAKTESEQLTMNMEQLAKVMQNVKGSSLNDLLSAQKILEQNVAEARPGSASYDTAIAQLKEVKVRIQEIKAEQQHVVTLMDKYDQETREVNKSLKQTEWETGLVEKTMKNLSKANMHDLEYSIKILNEQLRKTDRGTVEFERMQEQVKKLRTELERVRYEGAAQQPWINRMANWFNKIQGTVIVGVSSITGLTLTVRRAIQAFADMDQEMENVRKYTGQTTEQVHEMNEEFKEMDTRTSREKLNQLAGDAGRLGIQGKEAIMDFVDAADKINVALGDDLGENAVKNIGKLSMTFGTDKEKGLRGAMLATGSAVNGLAQNSSAAANYLVDFTARVAGFGKQVGLTQTQIMGFGAVMDENMLRDEMAATAFGQLLVKMTTDLDTFARLTGMKVEEYKKLVTEDINGAIIAVAKSLKGRDMQDLGKVFDAMNLDGQRAIGVLATLGQKIDDVQERQRIATKAFEEGTSIIEEYNIQNKTVQADLDRAKKKFNDLRIELGERLIPIARYGISTISLVIKALNVIAKYVVDYRSTLITLTVAIAAWNAATIVSIAWNKALLPVLTAVTNAAKTLWALLSKHPFGMIATGVAVAIAFMKDFTRVTDGAKRAVEDLNSIQKENATSVRIEKEEVDGLIKVINNQTASENDKRIALEKLNQKMQDYHLPNLTEEAIRTGKATQQLALYNKQFEMRLKLEAMQVKYQESIKRMAVAENYVEEHKIDKDDPLNRTVRGDHTGSDYLWNKNRERVEQEKKYQENLLNEIREAQESSSFSNWLDEQMEKQRQLLEGTKETETTTPSTFTDPKDEDKKRKAAEAAAKKLEAQQKKELKERNDSIKAQTEQEIAIVTNRYAKGEIDYRTYVNEINRIQLEGYEKRMAIYDQESDEYKKILNDREQYALKAQEKQERLNLKDVEKEHNEVTAKIEASYYNPKDDERYLNERAVNEALYQADLIYLQEKAKLYKKGSEERVAIEEDIEYMEQQHKLENERYYFEMLQQVREQYLQTGNEQQLKIALNGLESLHKEGLLKEEEYQRAKAAIQAQYASYQTPNEQARKTGSDMLAVASDKAKQQTGDNGQVPIIGTIRQYQATMEQLKVLYDNDKENHAAYLEAKRQASEQFCEDLAAEFQAAYNSINQVMSAASSLYSAQADYETAVVKKKYEKQIAAAGNNQKKVKKLQEKQAKEEAAVKNKYNAKQMKVQIAQAFSQMAINAITAYGAGLQVGGPAAPIVAAAFAAMALAAGMIQIAAIQKQQKAQQEGYYLGGYTGGKRYRKEAGVVHEGEWVASHKTVNNPNVRPVLDFLDMAQRNNRVGSLTAEDISRQLKGGNAAVVAPVVNVSTDNGELREALDQTREVNGQLLDIIENDGINILFPMDLFDKSYEHFKILNER